MTPIRRASDPAANKPRFPGMAAAREAAAVVLMKSRRVMFLLKLMAFPPLSRRPEDG